MTKFDTRASRPKVLRDAGVTILPVKNESVPPVEDGPGLQDRFDPPKEMLQQQQTLVLKGYLGRRQSLRASYPNHTNPDTSSPAPT